MSWTRCDCHGQTYTGRASSLYPSIMVENKKFGRRRKLCSSGLSDVLGAAGRFLTSAGSYDGNGLDVFQTCGWCGEPRGEHGGAAVFLTVYKFGKEREDFAGCACDKHIDQAADDLLVDLP